MREQKYLIRCSGESLVHLLEEVGDTSLGVSKPVWLE